MAYEDKHRLFSIQKINQGPVHKIKLKVGRCDIQFLS